MLYATITLDKERKVKYTIRKQIELEKMFGKSLFDILGSLKNSSTEDAIKILWKGLQHEDPDLKFDDVLNIIEGTDASSVEILNAVSIGIGYALWGKTMDKMMEYTQKKVESGELKPEDINPDADPSPNAQRLTGTNSSTPESACSI